MISSSPRLLMLGASDTQQVAIERAKARGLYVITADNRPDNPGHRLADESHTVSTTDLDGVLNLAKKARIDGVISYASDPGALTAAYVADHLNLPGDPLAAVTKAQDKFSLRSEQRKLGHPVPDFVLGDDLVGLERLWALSETGLVVKPTDRAGSAGLCIFQKRPDWADLIEAIAKAKAMSFKGRVIVEARLNKSGMQFGGDYLVENGQVRFAAHADQFLFRTSNTEAGLGSLGPSSQPAEVLAQATHQVVELVMALGLRHGIYNTDVCLSGGQVHVLDFGARLGGNWLGQVHHQVTGIDLTDLALRLALGEELPKLPALRFDQPAKAHAGHLVVHADREGVLQSLSLSQELEAVVIQSMILAKEGQQVHPYRSTQNRLGILLIKAQDRARLVRIYQDPVPHFGLVVQ